MFWVQLPDSPLTTEGVNEMCKQLKRDEYGRIMDTNSVLVRSTCPIEARKEKDSPKFRALPKRNLDWDIEESRRLNGNYKMQQKG